MLFYQYLLLNLRQPKCTYYGEGAGLCILNTNKQANFWAFIYYTSLWYWTQNNPEFRHISKISLLSFTGNAGASKNILRNATGQLHLNPAPHRKLTEDHFHTGTPPNSVRFSQRPTAPFPPGEKDLWFIWERFPATTLWISKLTPTVSLTYCFYWQLL